MSNLLQLPSESPAYILEICHATGRNQNRVGQYYVMKSVGDTKRYLISDEYSPHTSRYQRLNTSKTESQSSQYTKKYTSSSPWPTTLHPTTHPVVCPAPHVPRLPLLTHRFRHILHPNRTPRYLPIHLPQKTQSSRETRPHNWCFKGRRTRHSALLCHSRLFPHCARCALLAQQKCQRNPDRRKRSRLPRTARTPARNGRNLGAKRAIRLRKSKGSI